MGQPRGKSGTPKARGVSPEPALAAVYDAYAEELFRYASMLLANPHDAEDALQQVFLKLASRRRTQIRSLGNYLRRAVRNECYRLARTRQRAEERAQHLDTPPLLETRHPSQLAELEEERKTLECALRALPPEQREVVHLKIYEHKSFQEIAEITQVSINTASSRYRYATEKLRSLLREEDEVKE